VKSSNSSNLNTTYWTSAFKLPIWRLKPEGCHKPRPHQRGDWSSPTLITSCSTSVSLAAQSLELEEEGEIIEGITDSGAAWSPSRWGHLV
jgi:hypothetical protein